MIKKMLTYLLLPLLPVLLLMATSSQATDQEIKLLLDKPFVRAEFTKIRKLKILSRPFTTTGKILFQNDKGLVWQTQKPIEDTLLIGFSGVSQLKKDSSIPVKIDNPIVKSASVVFITILSLELEKIKRIFDIIQNADRKGVKSYTLIPKDAMLKKAIKHIDISGKKRVETIYIEELSGDSTTVTLSNEIFDRSTLLSSEIQLLELM